MISLRNILDKTGVAEELMFQSATPEFISSSEINLNLSASREEWILVYISEARP